MTATCPRCGGSGQDPEPAEGVEYEADGTPYPVPEPQRCSVCGGSGEIGEDQPELL